MGIHRHTHSTVRPNSRLFRERSGTRGRSFGLLSLVPLFRSVSDLEFFLSLARSVVRTVRVLILFVQLRCACLLALRRPLPVLGCFRVQQCLPHPHPHPSIHSSRPRILIHILSIRIIVIIVASRFPGACPPAAAAYLHTTAPTHAHRNTACPDDTAPGNLSYSFVRSASHVN